MSKFLGIDSSTQSMTALIIDSETESTTVEESVNFDTHFGTRYGIVNGSIDLGDGEVHAPPQMWIESLDVLLETLCSHGIDLSSIAAVSGSGQQHGTVYLNSSASHKLSRLDTASSLVTGLSGVFSRDTAPIWMDSSTSVQCGEIETGVGGTEVLLDLTGNTAFERFSGPQIRKYSQNDPSGYDDSAVICLISSFIASLLAGKLVGVDAGDGSGTNLMDIHTRQWSPEALEATALNLPDKLLPIAESDRPVGMIAPYFVNRYDFSPYCQVFPFSGDNPCSLIGLGLVAPGQVALSLGTSDTLFACMDAPRTSATGEGAVFASPDGQHYMALICFMNGSLAREAIKDQFKIDWNRFTTALQRTPAGNNGGLMLPYFDAEIVPHVSEPGVIRQGLEADDLDANVRAVIEAQALSSRIHCEWMQVPIQSLSVTGGASVNNDILQVFANVHGCPVHRFETTNSAALGAALIAAHGHAKETGKEKTWEDIVAPFVQTEIVLKPDEQTRSVYNEHAEAYRHLEQQHTG